MTDMFRKAIVAALAALTITATIVPEANAWNLGSRSRHARTSTAGAPLAFQLFCLKNPSECRTSRRSVVAYTPKIRALLVSVNAQVNRSIKPRNERGDTWSVNPAYGDCDDYAMTKRHRLIRAGIPASALKIAVVRTRRGEGHAVLIVKTTAGEFALDNIRKSIVRRSQTGYRFEKLV
jgi:predicted transglutaminase-like cysteine proteinase